MMYIYINKEKIPTQKKSYKLPNVLIYHEHLTYSDSHYTVYVTTAKSKSLANFDISLLKCPYMSSTFV